MGSGIRTVRLRAGFGERMVLPGVDLDVPAGRVTALVGPAGSGKTTLLRCLSILHPVGAGAWLAGRILLDGADVFGPGLDPEPVRRAVGYVGSVPAVFPGSVRDNVLAGIGTRARSWGGRGRDGHRRRLDAVVEQALTEAGLWEHAADRLRDRARRLAPEHAWRLCLARTLALDPAVVLVDDPWLHLGPGATALEKTILGLAERRTVVLAARTSLWVERFAHHIAWIGDGRRAEVLFRPPA